MDDQALVARARRVAGVAARRARGEIRDASARERARQLRDHVTSFVLPRAESLDAPLLVALLGSTGAGKSSLMNALAGHVVSAAGVLRPTTRDAVVLAREDDARSLLAGPLAAMPRDRLAVVDRGAAHDGVVIVDAPDIDSIERSNRELADALVEAADVCVFVTTAARYADRVPWDVLGRARERGLPLLIVVNRLPPDEADRADVLSDVDRLVREHGLVGLREGDVEIVPIVEGAVDAGGQRLEERAVAPVRARLDALVADRDERRRVAARALAGALAGLAPLAGRVADDAGRERDEVLAVRAAVGAAYEEELAVLYAALRDGRFLRAEVLRQWHSFVGADQITRLFASGLQRVAGWVGALVRGTPAAPVALVEREATSDLVVLAAARASEAARRAASALAASSAGADALAADPGLWSATPGFAEALEPRIHDWVGRIADDVRAKGAEKKRLAFGASLGVNALGVAVMLGVFVHTAGVTGAEVGVAAATGFLNQKLLEALFGQAVMTELVDRARADLHTVLRDAFAAERARSESALADPDELAEVAAELRASVAAQAA
ncbi:MAG TPA: GTPase [Candidatus Limnocylindria bacterium]|nr:GTPase [Candidatus Limnocylindria bacterium]